MKKSIIKGGADNQAIDLPRAKEEAIKTLDHEENIIYFLTDKENVYADLKDAIDNAEDEDTVNRLMNSFEITGKTSENYTLTTLNEYIKQLLDNPILAKKPFNFFFTEDSNTKIPLIINEKKKYEQILADASKLQTKTKIIEESKQFYSENTKELGVLDKDNKNLEGAKRQIHKRYSVLKLTRTKKPEKDIRHLEDFYIHKNLLKVQNTIGFGLSSSGELSMLDLAKILKG